MSAVDITTLVPYQAVLENPTSTSKHLVRRRQLEMPPMENTQFQYSGNDSLKFNISATGEVLDGMDSYIKMKFVCSNGLATASRMFLEVGGCHALFRQVELSSQTGTLIQRYENYNRWYAIMSYATHSPQHVEVVESSSGDSFKSGYVSNAGGAPQEVGLQSSDDFKTATFTTLTDTFAVLGEAATRGIVLKDGDRIAVDVTGNRYYAKVASVADLNSFLIYSLANDPERTLPADDVVAGDVKAISVLKGGYLSTRAYLTRIAKDNALTSSTSKIVSFKPAVSFLQQKQWIPLYLIKQGIVLELTLERPNHVLNKGFVDGPLNSGAEDFDYRIYEPRFMAMLITVDKTIKDDYLAEFTEGALNMSFLSYKHDRRTFANTTEALNANFHIGVRSARHAFAVLQSSEISQATGLTAKNSDSLSTWLDFGVTRYQFKSGAEQFPYRAVECDAMSSDAFSNLMLSTNQHAGTLWNVRMEPNEWRRSNSLRLLNAADSANNTYDNISTKFIMSARLDRNDDQYTGLDLTTNPLDLEIARPGDDFTAGGKDINIGSIILHVFVAYDSLISISRDGVIMRK